MDEELNKPYWQIILNNASIRKQWEDEVGAFTNTHYLSKDLYSNDLRHQYAAAITARNLGADKTRFLGNANEVFNSSGGDARDREIDKINNEIGIKYGLENPDISKGELLQKLLNDHSKNKALRDRLLGN